MPENRRRIEAAAFVRETNQISNLAFRDISGLDTLAASAGLRKLRQLGLLEKRGSGANTYYVATHLVGETAESGNADNAGAPLQGTIQGSLQDKDLSLQDRLELMDAKFPMQLKRRLVLLRLGKRAEPEEMKNVIVEICRHFDLSRELISIHRNETFVSQNYLTNLMKEGRLELTIPQSPSHPDQKYKASRKKTDAKLYPAPQLRELAPSTEPITTPQRRR
jgi:ATP-dependent DNA helicase RecG